MQVEDFLELSAARFPDKTALVCGERRLRYAEIEAQCNRLAHALRGEGVQPGDRAYITILGRVAMALPPGAKVGARLAVGADGAAVIATSGDASFGRVASQGDATGQGSGNGNGGPNVDGKHGQPKPKK